MKQINSLNRSELRMGLGMHRARIQTGNPGFSSSRYRESGFSHSDSDNYELRNPGSEGLQNSSQQDSEFYTEQQNLNNSHGQLLT